MTTTAMEKRSVAGMMVAEGDSQITELHFKIAQLEDQISEAEAEITHLHEARAVRGEAITTARTAADDLEATYTEATGYAKLAQKKPHQPEAIKVAAGAKKAWQDATQRLNQLIEEDTKVNSQADGRKTELHKLMRQAGFEMETHQAELHAVQAGRDKAHAELGQERYTLLSQRFSEKQAREEEMLAQLIEAQIDAHDYHVHACAELAEWPDLAADMTRQVPPQDAYSRAIAATLEHVEMLMRELPQLDDLPSELKRRGHTLWNVLLIHPDEITSAHYHPERLQHRLELTQKLLAEYKVWLSAQ